MNMKPKAVELLAKKMADRVGHGQEEKCLVHAAAAIEYVSDYSFYAHHLLHEAWRQAESNEECANILRLYLNDFKEFQIQYAPSSLARP
jgi:hypothetical protein